MFSRKKKIILSESEFIDFDSTGTKNQTSKYAKKFLFVMCVTLPCASYKDLSKG